MDDRAKCQTSVPCCLSCLAGSLLAEVSRLQKCLLWGGGLGQGSWGHRVMKNPMKIRAQWPVVFPGQKFLCFHSWSLGISGGGFALSLWGSRLCLDRQPPSKSSPLSQPPSQHQQVPVAEFLCHWRRNAL